MVYFSGADAGSIFSGVLYNQYEPPDNFCFDDLRCYDLNIPFMVRPIQQDHIPCILNFQLPLAWADSAAIVSFLCLW